MNLIILTTILDTFNQTDDMSYYLIIEFLNNIG
jgi:hypothetical protein